MTVAGYHTVGELADLWSAYSYELAQLTAAAGQAGTAWAASDAAGWQSFDASLGAFQAFVTGTVVPRLSPVLAGSGLAVDASGDVFDWLVAQWLQGPPGGMGLNDLDSLFRSGPQAKLAPTYEGMPQPRSPDSDLQAFLLADAAYKAAKSALSTGGSLLLLGLGFGLVVLLMRRK